MKLVSDQGEVLLEDSGQIPFLPRHCDEDEHYCNNRFLVHIHNSIYVLNVNDDTDDTDSHQQSEGCGDYRAGDFCKPERMVASCC